MLQYAEASDRATKVIFCPAQAKKKAGAQNFDDERAQKAHLQVGVVVDNILALDTLVHDETNDSKSRHTVKNVEQTTGKQKRRRIRWRALGVLLDDASQLLGVKRRTLLKEVLAERAGRRFAVSLLAEQLSLWIFPPRVSKNHRY